MKPKKKTLMVVSFALGSLIFATTALADIAHKSGYDQLKDSLKGTAAACTDTLQSYTLDLSVSLKDNGKTLSAENTVHKIDQTKNAYESSTQREQADSGRTSSISYSEPSLQIFKNSADPTYLVTEFSEPRQLTNKRNPFQEERAADLERIVDAAVGSLKDQVIVTENPDGTKEFKGSLTETQIPTLVNALISFQTKQQFNGQNAETPALTKDIFVKEVSGSAHVNAEGLLEDILGSVTIVGKDAQGGDHNLTFEFLAKLSDINHTVVSKPDLTGQKVQKNVAMSSGRPGFTQREAFIGKFSNDIVTKKDGKFVKIGERVITITEINDQHVVGTYAEKYASGTSDQASAINDFSFDAAFNTDGKSDPSGANFTYTNSAGKKLQGNIHFDETGGKIYFNINRISYNQPFDSAFGPDFNE